MRNRIKTVFAATLVMALCGAPELAGAMAQSQSGQQQQDSATPQSATPANSQAAPEQQQQQPAAATETNNNGESPRDQGLPDAPSAQTTQGSDNNAQQGNEPVGTAAAQAGKTRGGVASKPAGAAIAPAKQKRTRSLLIKLGLIAGAGVAVGSVYALSKGSPSKPPGAH